MPDIQKGAAFKVLFVLVDSSGVEVAGLGSAFTVQISKNGAAFGASAGTKAEIGNGWYSYTLTVAETNTAGPLSIIVTGTGAVQQNLLFEVVGYVVTAASGNAYCTLSQLKARLTITDTNDDTTLGEVIDAVSREIDNECRRRFYTTDVDEIRYFTADDGGVVFTDDIISVTTLETDEAMNRTYSRTWAVTDFDLLPDNAALYSKPYTRIVAAPNGRYSFPMTRKAIKITGRFGYFSTVPAVVREACLIQAERIFKRKDAPFGIMGAPDVGYVRLKAELDPDVKRLLDGVRKAML